MQTVSVLFITLLACIFIVDANVEKVVFLGPKSESLSAASRSVEQFQSPFLERLDPSNSSLRRILHSQFDSSNIPGESEAWILLDELEEGRRYEVRTCWCATVCRLSAL